MPKFKLEYIWLDGYTPVPNLRGKTQIKEFDSFPTLEQLPNWGFDGSSTQQAEGRSSDCVLKPVAIYPDSTRTNGAIVMCEVMMPDGVTPHPSNARATILDDPGAWFGFEQEYFLYENGRPLGFPKDGYPAPQGPYYCGAGYSAVGDVARFNGGPNPPWKGVPTGPRSWWMPFLVRQAEHPDATGPRNAVRPPLPDHPLPAARSTGAGPVHEE
jgi:glutamine synthetase